MHANEQSMRDWLAQAREKIDSLLAAEEEQQEEEGVDGEEE